MRLDIEEIEHIDDQMTENDEVISIIEECLDLFDSFFFEKQRINTLKHPLSALIKIVELEVVAQY